MDIADWLEATTQKCHLVVSPDQVIRIAPDLCVDAPSLWDLGAESAQHGERRVYPVACTAALAQPVAAVIAQALSAALEDRERESFAQYSAADWAADPLSSILARLLLEAALVSPEATGLPLLELARIGSGLMSANPPTGIARGSEAANIERDLPRLSSEDPARQGRIFSQVAWSLSARIGAAWGLATQAVPGLRPTRFYQALLRSKLSLVLRPDGSIPDLDLLLGVLGLPSDGGLLARLLTLCEDGIKALEARQHNNKAKPADRLFAASILSRAAVPLVHEHRARLLAHDPEVATAYLLQLASFHSAKDLSKLGLNRNRAKQLLDPELAQALATTLGDALRCLQLWDLIGGVIALVRRSEDIRDQAWQQSFYPKTLVPRGDIGDMQAFVVAARLGDVQGKSLHEARTNGDPLVPLALEGRFAALRADLEKLGR